MLRTIWIFAFAMGTALSLTMLGHSFGQDLEESELPDIDALFSAQDDSIPTDERPIQTKLNLPETLEQVTLPPTADERQELATWVRWLVLRNLPPSYEDNRKWGKQQEVFNGIQFRREGWKIETKRKKKSVKQGTWSRYYIEFIDPAENLEINIHRMEFPTAGNIRIATQIVAPLKLFGRVSQWHRDVQLMSISTNARATVEMNITCDVQILLNPLKIPPDVEFKPSVTEANIKLRDFNVDRISQMHGPLAELLGKGIREVLDNKLEEYDDKLVAKMNQEIGKQQAKLKLSVQDWLQTSVQKRSK
jgi:hypothetical protein